MLTWAPTHALLHAPLLPRLTKLPLLLGHASRLPKLPLLPHSLPWLAHAWLGLEATCSRQMQH